MPRHRPAPPTPHPEVVRRDHIRRLRAEGAEAQRAGIEMTANPYRDQPDDDRWDWQRGWLDAQIAAREAAATSTPVPPPPAARRRPES